MQIAILLYGYFSYLCNFVLLETIMTTLAMDQFGWAPAAAIARMGYIIIGAGAMSILVFGVIGPLSKRYYAESNTVQNKWNTSDTTGLTSGCCWYCWGSCR